MPNSEGASIGREKMEGSNIDKNLNDAKFLAFLELNSEATERAGDEEYLRDKVALFNELKDVKEKIKGLGAIEVDKNFVGDLSKEGTLALEKFAATNPQGFFDFSTQVRLYLETANKYDVLDKKSGADKQSKLAKETELTEVIEKRDWKSFITFIEKGKVYKNKTEALQKEIKELKQSGETDSKTISEIRERIRQIREDLKGTEGFAVLMEVLVESVKKKVTEAVIKKDHKTLAGVRTSLEGMKNPESIFFDEEGYDKTMEYLRREAKKTLGINSNELLDKKESNKLSVFENGVLEMQKKGIELGLSVEECNAKIVEALRVKIKRLDKTDTQYKIKVILTKRIIYKLEATI